MASNATFNDAQSQPQNSESEEEKLCRSFKRSLCHENVKVHFVGAWDTVSSIGIFRGQSFPETVSGMGHVCHFRHALALDERRAKFQPEYVNGGLGPIEGSTRGDVKEAWFKGTHSDIGGGNVKNENLDNFTDSLRWMTYEAQACGLFIKPYKGKWIPVTPKESLTWMWLPLEYLPFGSLSYITQNGLTWRPHRGQPRMIQSGQRIHQSVFSKVVTELESSNDECEAVLNIPGAFPDSDELPEPTPLEVPSKSVVYRPKAVLHSSLETNWEQLFSAYAESSDLSIIEQDPFENASHILASMSRACGILETEGGDKAHALNTIAADIQTLQSFLDDPYLAHQEGFPSIQNVAFSQVNTGQIIFTSCPDFGKTTSILTWDGSNQPPKNITNARGEYSTISRDGLLVVAWDGKDITIINTTKQPPTVVERTDDQDPYGGGDINYLCFSNDNQTFATGHEDGWIMLWKRVKDRLKVFRRFDGGNSGIYEVYGGSVKVWNLEDDAVVELEDPEDSTCPAWSLSGDWIVAGTNDGTLKVWNPNSGKIQHTLRAHRTYINCLAFRDDGKMLAMGSDGNRILGWKCDDWEKIWDFEIDDDVLSLAFSQDGKRLVSGGYRGSLHLWDIDMGHDNGNTS
ncbi:hypothetical protein ONZ45_g8477 [Pleurotus djamor]|nr:hypothetical protein ONZ45_g8477 [Pleurotus djamor]